MRVKTTRQTCINKACLLHVAENSTFYILQGFFLTVSPESIQKVALHAYENDKIFMMNLSAPFLCEYFQEPMLAALPYVDILFGNESEAEVFAKVNKFGTTDRRRIALKISQMRKRDNRRKRMVIITQGADAVLLARDDTLKEYTVPKLSESKVVDTNGAGDAFVGGRYLSAQFSLANFAPSSVPRTFIAKIVPGFLAQLVQGSPTDTCIKCGIWAASQIIQMSGCTYKGRPNFKP